MQPRNPMLFVAIGASILTLSLLHADNISVGLLVLTLLTYGIWWISALQNTQPSGQPRLVRHSYALPAMQLAHEPPNHALDQYYIRLFANLEFGWARLQQDHGHALQALHNVDRSLGKALDVAYSTGLLATNAMMAASECGEVGRGFVMVSRDLVGISEQSGEDLDRLRRMTRNFVLALSRCQMLVEHPMEFWLVSSAGLPITDLVKLRTDVLQFQRELNVIGERYRRAPQADVRWLQLGDAVKRLLSELINTLYQLELHLQDVLSDMRLLQLSQGTRQQIVEIKDRIPLQSDSDGVSQKFMF